MRVLLTTPDFPPETGGIQTLTDRLVRHSNLRYEVVTISMGKSDGVSQQDGYELTRVGARLGHRSGIAALNVASLRRAMDARPDAVVSAHVLTGLGALAVQRVTHVPMIQYLHAKEINTRPWLTRAVTRRADITIAVSGYTRRVALGAGAPIGRVRVIHPGVDMPKSEPEPTVLRSGPPTILTVARLEDRYKGFDTMIRALPLVRARVRNACWVVVGDGFLRGELQEMAHSHGVSDHITFTGRLDDKARDEWFDRAHVFAMPSRLLAGGHGGEGFGIVYLEAGAHRLPCVAGNVGGSVDAVLDGETGLLVDPTDHVAVADSLTHLLLDPDLQTQLGEGGRARAERLSWAHMAAQVDDLVERLVVAAKR